MKLHRLPRSTRLGHYATHHHRSSLPFLGCALVAALLVIGSMPAQMPADTPVSSSPAPLRVTSIKQKPAKSEKEIQREAEAAFPHLGVDLFPILALDLEKDRWKVGEVVPLRIRRYVQPSVAREFNGVFHFPTGLISVGKLSLLSTRTVMLGGLPFREEIFATTVCAFCPGNHTFGPVNEVALGTLGRPSSDPVVVAQSPSRPIVVAASQGEEQSLQPSAMVPYSSQGHSKTPRLVIGIDHPQTWIAKEGGNPHIVQKFESGAEGANEGFMLFVHALPERLNEQQILSLNSEPYLKRIAPPGAMNVQANSMEISGRLCGMLEYEKEVRSGTAKLRTSALVFQFVEQDHLVQVQCFKDGATTVSWAQLKHDMGQLRPLFHWVVNGMRIESDISVSSGVRSLRTGVKGSK